MNKNTYILRINRNGKPDSKAMFTQVLTVAFYKFCDSFEAFQQRYN